MNVKLLTEHHLEYLACLFDLIFCVPVTNLSVTSGRVFLGLTSTKLRSMSLAQGHNAVMPVRLEPAALWSRVKHSTTEPLLSYLEYLSLTGGFTGSSESILVKMHYCWKSHSIRNLQSSRSDIYEPYFVEC